MASLEARGVFIDFMLRDSLNMDREATSYDKAPSLSKGRQFGQFPKAFLLATL